MYKLTFSPASPYVRKVLLSAYKAGIRNQIELISLKMRLKIKLLEIKILLEKYLYYKNQMVVIYLIVE